ncbi:cubilin-like protein, partial [Leptotrombidium deliense]
YKEGTKCMFVIKKFKENVCHLDLMFITFEVGDATCQRDFLSIEGERLCGLIPKEKMKTFKFDASEKYVFFKGEIGGGLGFHIRGRQVECVSPDIHIDTPMLHPQPQQPVINRIHPDQRSVQLPYCDQTFTETAFFVSSPGYPNSYPNSLFCRFTIHRPTSSVCALDMKFRNFDVEDDPKCAKDYLEIDNGKICGHLPPNHERRYYYFPEEQKKIFVFRSDAFTSKSGFAIDVKQITDCSIHSWRPESPPPPVCDLCSSEVRGHFTSNNYPKSYENYVRCTYRISPHNEHYCKVRLHIRDLDIEESQACDKDYLYIQNERICNTNYRPKELTAYFPQFGTKEIQFSFHTDSRNTGRGFYVEFLQELCSASSVKPGNGHQYPSATTNGHTEESRNYDHHKGRSHESVSPQYPPNYVSKAHIEEIVETKVKVLDARSDPPSTVEYRNDADIRPVSISVQKAAKRSGVYNSTSSTFIEAH